MLLALTQPVRTATLALQDAAPASAPVIEVNTSALVAFIAYLLVLVGIGAWSARRKAVRWTRWSA